MILEKDSIFDHPNYLSCLPPSDLVDVPVGFNNAWQSIMQVVVRIPRFVRLVRIACRRPQDDIARREVTTLGIRLFQIDLDHWIQDLFKSGVIKEQASTDLEVLTPFSLSFPTSRLLVLLCQYWEFRTILCGCIDRLAALPPLQLKPAPPALPVLAAQRSDIQAGTYLIKSFEHMHKLAKVCPTVQLRFIWPVEMAFIVYYRLERRERMLVTHVTDPEVSLAAKERADAARDVQAQCLNLQSRWAPGWHPTGLTMDACRMLADRWSGGLIPPLLKVQHTTGEAKTPDD
jgi:hypothetical protein